MPYSREFVDADIDYLTLKGKTDVVAKIIAAQAMGKKVTWVSSSFDDPGNDWNRIEVEGEEEPIYKEPGY